MMNALHEKKNGMLIFKNYPVFTDVKLNFNKISGHTT